MSRGFTTADPVFDFVMAGLDPAIHPGTIGTRGVHVNRSVGVQMAGSSPAMTNIEPAMTNIEPAMTNIEPAMTNIELAMTNIEPAMTKGGRAADFAAIVPTCTADSPVPFGAQA
jgi:hypothetical protein